jgi:hypothetical protein
MSSFNDSPFCLGESDICVGNKLFLLDDSRKFKDLDSSNRGILETEAIKLPLSIIRESQALFHSKEYGDEEIDFILKNKQPNQIKNMVFKSRVHTMQLPKLSGRNLECKETYELQILNSNESESRC